MLAAGLLRRSIWFEAHLSHVQTRLLFHQGLCEDEPDLPLGAASIERRVPTASDLQIQIFYCGVCHSDLHFARDEWHFTQYSAVPGQEIVGRVTAIVSGVRKFKEMLDCCGQHNITSDIEMIRMDQINPAYERMLKSDVKYRFVIDVASLV